MAKRTCIIPDCEDPAKGPHGWCGKHWMRWKRHGDPEYPVRIVHTGTPEERFWKKVDKGDGSGCWLWTKATAGEGYGHFRYEGRMQYAHRLAYQWLVGPIPEGHDVDHIKANGCTSKLCVKAIADERGPAHLEPVTPRENNRRVMVLLWGDGRCRHGHPLDGINGKTGRRFCITCTKARRKARTARGTAVRRADRLLAAHLNELPDPRRPDAAALVAKLPFPTRQRRS